MSNLLKAVKLIVNNPIIKLKEYYPGRNRANSVGDNLENYVQDIFSDSFNLEDEDRIKKHNEVFSLRGNQNNPPDLILRNGDAIEIKKVQNPKSGLALNSSYPKDKIFSTSSMLTNACKTCEDWDVKDIIYVIGHTDDSNLKYLWLVYGDCFAAEKEVYERIKNTISSGITEMPDVEFTVTNELAKVNKVDPLGVTDLRIRGMWHIANPHKIFSYLDAVDDKSSFQMFCLMKIDKFNSFPEADKDYLMTLKTKGYSISNKKIKNPNNPAQLLDCIFITFKINI